MWESQELTVRVISNYDTILKCVPGQGHGTALSVKHHFYSVLGRVSRLPTVVVLSVLVMTS